MVFGIECGDVDGLAAGDVAHLVVETCYLGQPDGDGIHLLGALAGTVLRVSPPMTITDEETAESLDLLYQLVTASRERIAD